MKIIFLISWVSFAVGIWCLISCGIGQFFYWKKLNSELKIMEEYLSPKTFLLFCAACQNERHRYFMFYCFSPTVSSLLTNVAITYLVISVPTFYQASFWFYVTLNFTPCLVAWTIYFLFTKCWIDEIIVVINSIDPRTKSLKEYHVINRAEFNYIFSFKMEYYLTKRLLKKVKRNCCKRKILNWIYQLFHLYFRVYRLGLNRKSAEFSKDEIFFACQNKKLTFREMLKLVSSYFDNWDIEIKVLKIARLSRIKRIWKKLISDQNNLTKTLI